MEKKWEAPQVLAEFNPSAMTVNDILGDWGEWSNTWISEWTETA